MKQKNGNTQLGMSESTAKHRLTRLLLFDYAKQTGSGFCFRCGIELESVDNFSIEHKIDWLHSADPVGSFFDITNIAFSHRECNRPRYELLRKAHEDSSLAWCSGCQKWLDKENFYSNKSHWNGLDKYCKNCRMCFNARRVKNTDSI